MQSRVINVGFRGYAVINIIATTEAQEVTFPSLPSEAQFVSITNSGAAAVNVRFNMTTADAIQIAPNSRRDIPLKAKRLYVSSASGTANLEIIGYVE